MSPFLVTSVLDFWWYLLRVSGPDWAALFALGRGICVTCSLTFTSGVTPANLLATSMAAELISSIYLESGTQMGDLSLHRWMLYQMSCAGWLIGSLLDLPDLTELVAIKIKPFAILITICIRLLTLSFHVICDKTLWKTTSQFFI